MHCKVTPRHIVKSGGVHTISYSLTKELLFNNELLQHSTKICFVQCLEIVCRFFQPPGVDSSLRKSILKAREPTCLFGSWSTASLRAPWGPVQLSFSIDWNSETFLHIFFGGGGKSLVLAISPSSPSGRLKASYPYCCKQGMRRWTSEQNCRSFKVRQIDRMGATEDSAVWGGFLALQSKN